MQSNFFFLVQPETTGYRAKAHLVSFCVVQSSSLGSVWGGTRNLTGGNGSNQFSICSEALSFFRPRNTSRCLCRPVPFGFFQRSVCTRRLSLPARNFRRCEKNPGARTLHGWVEADSWVFLPGGDMCCWGITGKDQYLHAPRSISDISKLFVCTHLGTINCFILAASSCSLSRKWFLMPWLEFLVRSLTKQMKSIFKLPKSLFVRLGDKFVFVWAQSA